MNKVRLSVLVAAIAIVIGALPLNSASVNQKLSLQNFLRELSLKKNTNVAKYKSLITTSKEYTVEPTAEQLNERSFRLPNNTEPISYDIRLSTDIHRGNFGFQGEVRINIRAVEATNSITLHSRQTVITLISLFNPNGTVFEENLRFIYDSEVEFLVILVNRGLEADQEITVLIQYLGFLSNDLTGFFRTSYNNAETGEVTWLATTQFQPINARQAFPSYDEVRYRRPIDLQIRHHRNYTAISNMPVAELIENGEYVTTVFEQTLPIPTFVLAFTISDFQYVGNADPDLELRVYGRPSAIAAGQGDEGLRLGEIMLRTMEDLFDMPYSLPKSDQVAIPSFASDGALNWGLITHREDIILQFNNDTGVQEIRQLRIAHEYAVSCS